MSRFTKAMSVLSTLGLPLFERMAAEGQAFPMDVSTQKDIVKLVHPGMRNRVRGALGLLAHSRRYVEACAAPGAMRHDVMGRPTVPVSEAHRLWALGRLEEKRIAHERKERERQAAYQTDPRWGDKIRSGA